MTCKIKFTYRRFLSEDTIETFTNLILEAAFIATSQQQQINSNNGNNGLLSTEIRELIANRRKLRRIYQTTGSVLDKTTLKIIKTIYYIII